MWLRVRPRKPHVFPKQQKMAQITLFGSALPYFSKQFCEAVYFAYQFGTKANSCNIPPGIFKESSNY